MEFPTVRALVAEVVDATVREPEQLLQKFKRLKREPLKAWAWVNAAQQQNPRLFAHWHLVPLTPNRPAGAG